MDSENPGTEKLSELIKRRELDPVDGELRFGLWSHWWSLPSVNHHAGNFLVAGHYQLTPGRRSRARDAPRAPRSWRRSLVPRPVIQLPRHSRMRICTPSVETLPQVQCGR